MPRNRGRLARRSLGGLGLADIPGNRGVTSAPADCRWKAGLRTEVALDGLHLVIFKTEILHVAKRFAVLGMTNVHHKRLVAASKYPLQVKPLDKINL